MMTIKFVAIVPIGELVEGLDPKQIRGSYYEGVVYIRKGMSFSNTVKTVLHEVGHWIIEKAAREDSTNVVQYWWDISWTVFSKHPILWKIEILEMLFRKYMERKLLGDKEAEYCTCFRKICKRRLK